MKRYAVLITLVILAFALSCKMVDQVASTGSKIFMTAQPQEINANGFSTLTVTGIRGGASGAPLPDGTVITFTVDNAGSVTPNPVETSNGVAVAQFHAANFSATINVTATSGGADNSKATVPIVVGDARAVNMLLSADPPVLPFEGGHSTIRAIITDKNGNRLQGIGVQFTSDKGTLNSGGTIVTTNQNGLAVDVLNTLETAKVTATTLNHTATGSVTVTVGTTALEVKFQFSPTAPEIGDTVFFTDITSDPGGTIRSWSWNFGDGSTGKGKTTTHAYRTVGEFIVTLTVVDSSGNSFVGTGSVKVVIPTGIECKFTVSPTNPNVGETVSFNGSESTDSNGTINSYKWDFGDGTPSKSGVTTSHVYLFEGTFTPTLTLKDNNGATASCSPLTVSVGCPTVDLSDLPDGVSGNPYSATIVPTPAGNYTFSVSGGSLPPPLTLNSLTGLISGTPSTAGVYNFTVTATPVTGGCSVSRSYTVTIS